MNNYTLNLNPNINGTNGLNYPRNPIIFKGESKLILDLNNFKDKVHDVIQIEIDYGDNSGVHSKINDKFLFTTSFSSSKAIYEHLYQPVIDDNYYFRYYLTIDIYFSNFTKYRNKFDIVIYKDSFYSLHKKLRINSAQFVDDADDSMFTVLSNDNGDKFNFIIK
jgi:hypothetical protein